MAMTTCPNCGEQILDKRQCEYKEINTTELQNRADS